jgi:ABC-type transport system involved in multi-copper enzyme maturation permease subunit
MANWAADVGQIASRARWLTGPILDKELRVASRRRRYYLMRFAYVGLLTCFVLGVWFSYVRRGSGGSVVYQASRIGVAGRYIAVTLVWFQFLAAQLIAAVLLSDAINGEVRKRTLGVLAVTGVTSVQIVVGKLAGRFLQIGLLLVASLPLLAVVRVFGGVPWDYVVSGLGITLGATLFAGALSLLFSAFCRQAYTGVLGVLACYWVLFSGSDLLLGWLARVGRITAASAESAGLLTNPFVLLRTRTTEMFTSQAGPVPSSRWPWHCLVLLAASGAVLMASAWRVRYVAACSPGDRWGRHFGRQPRPARAAGGILARHIARRRALRPGSSPVVWKELHASWLPRHRAARWAAGIFVAGACLVLLAVLIVTGEASLAGSYLSVLYLAFLVRLATGAAGGIAGEREARTLSVLLATPLEDREIVNGKALAALYRSLPLLVPVPLLCLLASWSDAASRTGTLESVGEAGLHLLSLAALVLFVLGLGLYFSVRLKTTAAAVVTTVAVCFGLTSCTCNVGSLTLGLAAALAGHGGKTWGAGLLPAAISALVFGWAGLSFLHAATDRLRGDALR